MYPFINIGSYCHIPVYNLCIGIGIVCAMLLLQYNSRINHLSERQMGMLYMAVLVTIITGFSCAYFFDAFTQRLPLFSGKGGLTLMGGMVGGMACLAICINMSHMPVLPTFNLLTPSFAIAHFFGRLGCFFAGCCFGKPTGFFTGVRFPTGSLPWQHYHSSLPIHPTQLYEALFALVLCALLLSFKPRNAFLLYMLAYAVFRFFIEYLRNDERGIISEHLPFSPSQFLSLLMLALVLLYYTLSAYKKPGTNMQRDADEAL